MESNDSPETPEIEGDFRYPWPPFMELIKEMLFFLLK